MIGIDNEPNGRLVISIEGKDRDRFKELVQRGTNLWPDAHPNIKDFADLITVGHIQQNYHDQAKDLHKDRTVDTHAPQPMFGKIDESVYAPTFEERITAMNSMYELAPIEKSYEAMGKRLVQFKKILTDECAEIVEIQDIAAFNRGRTNVRVALADLLGDIVVYCTSEAQRWNIPLPEVLSIIMDSNASKLGADGRPIKDPETGKFLKGPHYWKPESRIKELLESAEFQC